MQETPGVYPVEAGAYPRAYRMTLINKVVFGIMAGVLIVGFSLGAWYFGTGHEVRNPTAGPIMAAVSLFMAVAFSVAIYVLFRVEIRLEADAIEYDEVFRTRRLRRDQIAGKRRFRTQSGGELQLIPRDRNVKKLRISLLFERDAVLDAWLATIPDLDADERASFEAEIAADPRYGATPQERLARLAHARKAARVLTIAAVAATFWGWRWPVPYAAAIIVLVVLPPLGLLVEAWSAGLIQIRDKRGPQPSIIAVVLFPPLVLAFRAIMDTHLADWHGAIADVAGAAAVVALAVLMVKPGARRPLAVLVVVVIALIYASGTIVLGNVLTDRSAAEMFRPVVLDRHKTTGRQVTFNLRLEPWGPRQAAADVTVPKWLYDQSPIGRNVCVALRSGTLGIPWFTVGACD